MGEPSHMVSPDAPATALVVAGDRVTCMNCSHALSQMGYSVRFCERCAEAPTAVMHARPDVAVVCLQGPEREKDGQLILGIRQRRKRMAIVAIAGHPTVREAVNLLKAGVDEILPEPFSCDELTLAVAMALRHRQETSC
jgi:DNA-binding NtrC family response regulator